MIQSARPQHVHLVLDDDEAVALIDELLEHIKESRRASSRVEARRALVHAGMRAVSEVASKRPRYFTSLEPLGLAPRRGCCRGWPSVEVAEATSARFLADAAGCAFDLQKNG